MAAIARSDRGREIMKVVVLGIHKRAQSLICRGSVLAGGLKY